MRKVLSLGAGVQSTALLLMSVEGEIERPDFVVFADTGWEPLAVYEQLERLRVVMEREGIPFEQLSVGNIKDRELSSEARDGRGETKPGTLSRYLTMPYYCRNRETDEKGMLNRQCTRMFKINPVNKAIKKFFEIPRMKANTNPEPLVERWYGITTDEIRRMRLSKEWWAENYYPLVDLGLTRTDCKFWLEDYGWHDAPKSACVACPYRSDAEWRKIKDNAPEEFAEACEFDDAIRESGGPNNTLYVHRSGRPLRQADLSTAEDHGQERLFDDECAGMCGV